MKFGIKKVTDIHKLLISYFIAIAVFQIVFFMENILINIRSVSVLFWLFVLPGFGITYLWKFNFLERLAVSVAISAAIVGISSYYLGLAGLHVTASSVVLPIVYILMGLLVIHRKKLIPKK